MLFQKLIKMNSSSSSNRVDNLEQTQSKGGDQSKSQAKNYLREEAECVDFNEGGVGIDFQALTEKHVGFKVEFSNKLYSLNHS